VRTDRFQAAVELFSLLKARNLKLPAPINAAESEASNLFVKWQIKFRNVG
jgi:1-deoxy-D-xylulose 5-phosphate reductoisomerase